jgi:mono/diheme cytochrome c family protein
LKSTITRGISSSLMPPFGHLGEDQREQLALAVELLARRGEFEARLVLETELKETALGEGEVGQIAAEIDAQWREAADQVIQPLSPQPVFTPESVSRGKKKFVQKGCAKCHGEDGRGQTEQNLQGGLRDVWGHPVWAADLTTGRLKGGSAPLDIYRRILGGINGTPMPSFRAILWAEPESIWDLVAWVLHLGRIHPQFSGEGTDD